MKRKDAVTLHARITNVFFATKLATALTTVETLATKKIAKVISISKKFKKNDFCYNKYEVLNFIPKQNLFFIF